MRKRAGSTREKRLTPKKLKTIDLDKILTLQVFMSSHNLKLRKKGQVIFVFEQSIIHLFCVHIFSKTNLKSHRYAECHEGKSACLAIGLEGQSKNHFLLTRTIRSHNFWTVYEFRCLPIFPPSPWRQWSGKKKMFVNLIFCTILRIHFSLPTHGDWRIGGASVLFLSLPY